VMSHRGLDVRFQNIQIIEPASCSIVPAEEYELSSHLRRKDSKRARSKNN
jgi:hypothetical protein